MIYFVLKSNDASNVTRAMRILEVMKCLFVERQKRVGNCLIGCIKILRKTIRMTGFFAKDRN